MLSRIYQHGIDWVVVMAFGAFCVLQASAAPLMWLVRPEAVEGASTLRVLGCAILPMFVTAMLGPVFIVARRQWLAFIFCAAGVLVNAAMNAVLIARCNYFGASVAALITETVMMIPALVAVQRLMGYRLRWGITARTGIAAAAALAAVYAFGLWDTGWGGVLAALLFSGTALLTRAVKIRQLEFALGTIRSHW